MYTLRLAWFKISEQHELIQKRDSVPYSGVSDGFVLNLYSNFSTVLHLRMYYVIVHSDAVVLLWSH